MKVIVPIMKAHAHRLAHAMWHTARSPGLLDSDVQGIRAAFGASWASL